MLRCVGVSNELNSTGPKHHTLPNKVLFVPTQARVPCVLSCAPLMRRPDEETGRDHKRDTLLRATRRHVLCWCFTRQIRPPTPFPRMKGDCLQMGGNTNRVSSFAFQVHNLLAGARVVAQKRSQ